MLEAYKTFYQFIFKYKLRFAGFLVALTILGIAESIQPYFYKLFIDEIAKPGLGKVFVVLVWFFSVRLAQAFANVVTHQLGDWVVLPASRDARSAVIKKIQDLDMAFHLSKSTGSLISVIKRGDSAFFDTFDNLHFGIVRVAINLIVTLWAFNSISPFFVVITLTVFIANLFIAKGLIAVNLKARKEFNEEEDKLSALIVDNLLNYETVKLFAKEKREEQRLKDHFVVWLKKFWGYANSFRVLELTLGILGNLGFIVVLYLTAKRTLSGAYSPGDFVLVVGFMVAFYSRFFDFVWRLRSIFKNQVDIEKYFGIFENKTLVIDPDIPVTIKDIKGEIEFRNVAFSYPEGKRDALKNFNLKVRVGQSVALVGESGAGKTTVAKLLMRFYDTDEGTITVDGIDIRDMEKSYLRSNIGVVPQDPILFNNTVAFNIGYGLDNPTQEQIEGASKMANLYDFIKSLPKGYQTEVGERGVKLSGGQKQRLAIARMMLANPEIVILDEATSQLDSETEAKIQEAFWKVAKNKTTLIIAHRLSTVMRADKIVVIGEGEVKEEGPHKVLVANPKSLYSRYWKLQSKAY
ncbi:ABC transporter ATP-binding protein/permease [Patescibacteria group bacterium]|nr:ABC transporter ATP-binding protein/permease [Patescibacteria group bacterium]